MITTKFEVGKRYMMRSACDHECIWTYEVISRTTATVVLQQVNKDGEVYGEQARCRINAIASKHLNAEAVRPLGTYSMAPILSADNEEPDNVMTYEDMKEKYADALILFRRDSEYDAYRQDAEACHKVLGIEVYDMFGIPNVSFQHKMLDVYLPKLVRSGYRVVIVENRINFK